MGHPQVAAFARLAEGSAKAIRAIAGQNTLFARTIHDMAYDPVRDEIVVPQFYAFAILTFRGDANGDVAPVRKIFGPSTQLKNPQRLAVDPVHGEIFVPQEDAVLVFPRDANGDVAPIRILKGPKTGFPESNISSSSLAVDPVNNLLIVSATTKSRPGEQERREEGVEDIGGGEGQLLIFNRTDSGNAAPRAVIAGPHTKLRSGRMSVYPQRGYILVGASGGRSSPEGFVGVWSIRDRGDVPPLWTIGGPNGQLRDIRGVDVDVKNKSVIISDKYLNAVLTYSFPEIF